MIANEAVKIASEYVVATLGRELTLIGARKAPRHPSQWNVIYETTLSNGKVMDGPTVVIVDEDTRLATFFEGGL